MKKFIFVLAVLFFAGNQSLLNAEEKSHDEMDPQKIMEILSTTPPWVYELWTKIEQEDGHIKSTCAHLTYFFNFHKAYMAAKKARIEDITLYTAFHDLAEESTTLAMLLLRIYDIPLETRSKAPSCGNLVPDWSDSFVLSSLITEVLKTGHKSPQSLGGMSITDVREKLLKDIREILEQLAKKTTHDGDNPEFREYLSLAVKNCKLTARDLTTEQQREWKQLIKDILPPITKPASID